MKGSCKANLPCVTTVERRRREAQETRVPSGWVVKNREVRRRALLRPLGGDVTEKAGSPEALIERLVALCQLSARHTFVALTVVGEEVRNIPEFPWDLIQQTREAKSLIESIVALE